MTLTRELLNIYFVLVPSYPYSCRTMEVILNPKMVKNVDNVVGTEDAVTVVDVVVEVIVAAADSMTDILVTVVGELRELGRSKLELLFLDRTRFLPAPVISLSRL